MKIIGNERQCKISKIRLKHQGQDLNFDYIIFNPYLRSESENEFNEINHAEIIFDDLCEVDNMILMLNKFREQCRDSIGEWRQ